MNKTVAKIGDMLDRRRIPYQTRMDDENVIRFGLTLPSSRADVVFFVSYFEQNKSFNLAINRIARFKERIIEAYRFINRFNSDPDTYNCKMFLDSEGYVIVTCNSIIEGNNVVGVVEEYIGVAMEALDRYYPELVEVIEKGNAEVRAAREEAAKED